jgi:hypothetical protein
MDSKRGRKEAIGPFILTHYFVYSQLDEQPAGKGFYKFEMKLQGFI